MRYASRPLDNIACSCFKEWLQVTCGQSMFRVEALVNECGYGICSEIHTYFAIYNFLLKYKVLKELYIMRLIPRSLYSSIDATLRSLLKH